VSAVELPHRIDEGPAGAPVLVLSNSLGATTAMWDPQVAALAQHFRVVRYEHRGHAGAPVPPEPYSLDDLGADVLALLDRLGVERVHFCGVSLGGMVGMWLAINAPQRLRRLVLCCTSAMLAEDHDWADRARRVREGGSAAVAESVVERWFTAPYAAAHPDLVERMRAMVGATPAVGYAGCCEAIRTMDLRLQLPRATTPTLVVAGAQDPATRPIHAQRIAALMPDCRMAVVDAAHLANVELPEAVTGLIRSYLLGDGDGPRGHEGGTITRREVLGDAHVDRAVANTTDFSAPFQDFLTRYAWGEVWTRPGLDRRMRSAITLTALTALRAENEIAIHVRGAINNGLTPEEIGEVILHTAVYAGVPAANAAFAIAQRTLAEMDVPQARPRDRA
jgi:3-oxoadipate enol-lactonase / 4-carboxymuconolactone decarboxylase